MSVVDGMLEGDWVGLLPRWNADCMDLSAQ